MDNLDILYDDYKSLDSIINAYNAAEPDKKSVLMKSVQGYFNNIIQSFNILVDTSLSSIDFTFNRDIKLKPDDGTLVKEADLDMKRTYTLKYLYPDIIQNVNVPLDSNNNYLQNVIENVYNDINHRNANVILFNTDKAYSFNKVKDDNTHKTQEMMVDVYDDSEKTNLMNRFDILNTANHTATYDFFFTYAGNLIILFVIYYINVNSEL